MSASLRRPFPSLPALAFGCAVFLPPLAAVAQEPPSREEMWKTILTQQEQIQTLTKRLDDATHRLDDTTKKVETTEKKIVATEERIEATGAMVEQVRGAGSTEPGWWQQTSLGGYGELHYNAGDKDEVDFHRFVLFFNHAFSDRVRLFTELELEHSLAGEGKNGEVELEQAYIQIDLTENHRANLGLQLLPVGLLNITHEPPTFFGVERNPVETNIIPTTWWEAGAGVSGELSENVRYDILAHSGLETPITGGSAFKIRSGRKKVSNASADDGAYTGHLNWTALPGVAFGVTGQYQSDLTQGALDVAATLVELHTDIRRGPWGLRALYARWDLDGAAPEALGRDVQDGWYIEPSYRFRTGIGEMGLFARFNQWDNNAGLSGDTQFQQIDFGINYWPHEDVVLKADVQIQDAPMGETGDDRLNLGVGFQF